MRNEQHRASPSRPWLFSALLAALLAVSGLPAFANGGVTLDDVATASGITYQRTPSPRLAIKQAIEAQGVISAFQFFTQERPNSPMKPYGAPGIALLDYDNDGDVDIYVTNGPGADNSLYRSRFAQTGNVVFDDVAAAQGVAAAAQDSTGVCYGDIDNDGDQDLYVLGVDGDNHLFENQGASGGYAFTDITAASGTGGGGLNASVCSFGDFDNDGLLDLVVGNTYDTWNHMLPVFGQGYIGRQHNQLFSNQGGNVFADVSAASGIETVDHTTSGALETPTLTWGIAAVDYDSDGDTDILWGDSGGYNRVFENDGSGHFTDRTVAFGLDAHHGSWMGFSFGDFDCDGQLDFFSTDLGNYLGAGASRWFLQAAGGFTDPGLGPVVATPFGWGNVTTDYDNDGDTDIVFHGAMDLMSIIMGDNPGVVLQNQGCGTFEYDFGALTRDHSPRVVEGVAVGDLDNDGFDDVVSAAGQVVVPSQWWLPWAGILSPPLGPLDPHTYFEGVWLGDSSGNVNFLSPTIVPGDLAVELNSGGNGNASAAVTLHGGAGTIPSGTVNRNGIGAVLHFTPAGGNTTMRPVTGGESYASANSLTVSFGLGTAATGTVEVLWPGGVRNRLYDVAPGERLVLPEIPCSFDGAWANHGQYNACVQKALTGYLQAGVLTAPQKNRLRASAERAFYEVQ